jgi:FHA domain
MVDSDLLALGLGGTSMMAMLWTIASGRRAVGVEMRGDPFLGVRWNIREDLYHQLGLIDQLMLERFGEGRIPHRANGKVFRLAECFYSRETSAGDIVADEVIDGFDSDQHIVGTIRDVEFIDDRWRDGLPNRVIHVLVPPRPPDRPDPDRICPSMVDVLDGPSTYQAEAASIQKLLRRYLELIEQQDRNASRAARVQLFTHHRVVPDDGDGFIDGPDGRKGIRIEALQEFDFKGQFVRMREPGAEVIDLGVPELFIIAEGFNSSDAKRLGFEQSDVVVDHKDGRGSVVAQADFLAGLVQVLVGGRLRRRISSEFDQDGQEYWVRQIAVGHENDPEVGWVLVQVPDFKTFDPIESKLVPAGTDADTPEYFAAFQHLLYDYYLRQAADVLDIPRDELKQVQMVYGPKLFSLVERVGSDPLVAANGVVAGDSFGNGHFLTSGGAMTGMIGHGARVREYWRARDAGDSPARAIRKLADSIKADTHAWLRVSAKEYSEALPINFGAERIAQINQAGGGQMNARSKAIDAARRHRHDLIPLNPSDWRRLFIHNGKVISELPKLEADHPLKRPERAASLAAVMLRLPATPDPTKVGAEPGSDHKPPADRLMPVITQVATVGELAQDPRARTTSNLTIGTVSAESARSYAFLHVMQDEQIVQRFEISQAQAVIGRGDPQQQTAPDIDLARFDSMQTVSRRHAAIHREKGVFSIEDLDSRNTTQVADATLSPGRRRDLRDGDVVRLGSVRAVFRVLGNSDLPVAWSPS